MAAWLKRSAFEPTVFEPLTPDYFIPHAEVVRQLLKEVCGATVPLHVALDALMAFYKPAEEGGRPPEETAGHALAEARDRPLRGLGSRAEPGRREVPRGEQGHARQRQPLHSRGRPLPQSADQGDGRVQERPPLGGLGVRRRADGGRGEVVEPLPRGRLRVGAKTRPKRTPSSSRRRSGRSQVCRAATVSPTRRSRCSASSTDRRTSESGSTS
jgi:hypothetical protein